MRYACGTTGALNSAINPVCEVSNSTLLVPLIYQAWPLQWTIGLPISLECNGASIAGILSLYRCSVLCCSFFEAKKCAELNFPPHSITYASPAERNFTLKSPFVTIAKCFHRVSITTWPDPNVNEMEQGIGRPFSMDMPPSPTLLQFRRNKCRGNALNELQLGNRSLQRGTKNLSHQRDGRNWIFASV